MGGTTLESQTRRPAPRVGQPQDRADPLCESLGKLARGGWTRQQHPSEGRPALRPRPTRHPPQQAPAAARHAPKPRDPGVPARTAAGLHPSGRRWWPRVCDGCRWPQSAPPTAPRRAPDLSVPAPTPRLRGRRCSGRQHHRPTVRYEPTSATGRWRPSAIGPRWRAPAARCPPAPRCPPERRRWRARCWRSPASEPRHRAGPAACGPVGWGRPESLRRSGCRRRSSRHRRDQDL